MRRVIASLFVFLTFAISSAEAKMIIGTGNQSCGYWTETRKGRDQAANLDLYSYAGGFLSSYNLAFDKKDILAGTDMDGLMGWMDNYCQANPLNKIALGLMMLILTLNGK